MKTTFCLKGHTRDPKDRSIQLWKFRSPSSFACLNWSKHYNILNCWFTRVLRRTARYDRRGTHHRVVTRWRAQRGPRVDGLRDPLWKYDIYRVLYFYFEILFFYLEYLSILHCFTHSLCVECRDLCVEPYR